MNILITGANGFIGEHLSRRLLAAGHHVTACVRNPAQLIRRIPAIRAISCDFSRDHAPADWLPRLENIDVVINTVGIIQQHGKQSFAALHRDTPIALFRACAQSPVKKIIQLSALGADDQAQSQYHLSKKAADDLLATLDIDWFVLRPSVVYGPRAKSMALFRAIAALPVIPLVDKGEQLLQPIHVDDLARVVCHLLQADTPPRQYIDLAGPAPVTLRGLYNSLRHWLGLRKTRSINIPWRLSLFMARLAGLFGKSPLDGETLRMLQRGNTADVSKMVEKTGVTPVAIDDMLYQSPCTTGELWHARLYFLIPLLRLTIALVWIATGLISAFIYPAAQSYQLLEQLSITGALAPLALYGGAIIDLLLGLALLLNYRIVPVGLLQISIILTYSLLIAIGLPEFWLHPFGPITKNIPFVIATLVVMACAEQR